MIEKIRLAVVSFTLLLVLNPLDAAAQQASMDSEELETARFAQPATDVPTAVVAESNVEVLRPFPAEAALLLAPTAASLPSAPAPESVRMEDEAAPTAPVAAQGSGTGMGFMIGGAAALVGGLLIGGTGGSLIAAGGVALGVYGAIIYF